MGGEIAPKLNFGVGGEIMKEPQISQPQSIRDSSHHCWPQVHLSCGVGEGKMDEWADGWMSELGDMKDRLMDG